MNRDVILTKIENIKNCLDRIEGKLPFSTAELEHSLDLQDIVTVNLQRAIQTAVDLSNHICSEKKLSIPQDMAESFKILHQNNIISEALMNNLVKAVGLRNVLVHDYAGINWEIVNSVVHERLTTFRDFCQTVVKLV